ncbi:MAG: redoxin domain-containing protein, partial [Spirochaetaceae bacterium]|nr:redoxin domain-containing protein [Spirochaetaceae bacterium]
MLLDYGLAPQFVAAGPWLGGGALTMAELRGKVLLLDFWTYSCVNCVRTIPALRAWHRAYSPEGLVIVGAHSPEFEFEKSRSNVAWAMKSLGIEWRVVQDNDFSQWSAYSNQYWPAHYLVDARGRVRYVHFGEGNFEDTEKAIRALLAEAKAGPGTAAPNAAAPSAVTAPNASGTASASAENRFVSPREPDLQDGTPEMYLGYARGRGFVSAIEPVADAAVDYEPEREPVNAEWNLEGRWTIASEYSVPDGTGALNLGFEAKDLYLVLVPGGRGSSIRVLVDGFPPPDTADVKDGRLRLSGARMYHLASFNAGAFRRLRLEVNGETRLYAF